jgi:tetratricopeptide (TPR) repeat protein
MRYPTLLHAVALVSMLGPASPTWGSPAGEKIEAAQKRIERNPKSADGYNALAMALAARARETADPDFYDRAEAAVEEALKITPGNLESQRARIWVALGKHEFGRARGLAMELNRRVPDDLMTYAFLVDANVELGRYEEAEKAADWLLRLRPGTVAGLTRAAYLRELFGDIEGALELMQQAFDRVPRNESEERAWILTQVSHLHLIAGRVEMAARAAAEALRQFPEYHYGLAAMAKVRSAQKRHGEAAKLYQRRYELAPHPENLYEVAQALREAGEAEESAAAFARFEGAARAEMAGPDNSNRELIAYYADVAGRPEEALRIAKMEKSRREDVYTLDAYAWALYRSGHREEARQEMGRVRAVGVLDPAVLAHASAME